MARTLNASFTEEKNKLEGIAPITLVEIEYGDVSSSKVWWAAWNKNIEYFQPGTATAQTYTAFPIEVSDLTYGPVSNTPSRTLTVSNVDRSIIAYLENNDALRGRKVTILKVFQNLLTNSSAYVKEAYYVDGGSSTRDSAQLTIIPKSSIYNITMPKRTYRRDQCYWTFKSVQCAGTATINATTTNATLADTNYTTCMKTLASCEAYNNVTRYGGFPGIPRGRVYIY